MPRDKGKQFKAKVISVRWVDINKGYNVNGTFRSWLVARDIKTNHKSDLFAATPPLEALKMPVSMLASSNRGGN